MQFSVSSGYSAVTLDANAADNIKNNFVGSGNSVKDQNILNALLVSADVYMNEKTYVTKPFGGSKDARDVLSAVLSNVAVTDREAVAAAIAQGKTREEATAPYVTDEYFDAWFASVCEQIENVVQ